MATPAETSSLMTGLEEMNVDDGSKKDVRPCYQNNDGLLMINNNPYFDGADDDDSDEDRSLCIDEDYDEGNYR